MNAHIDTTPHSIVHWLGSLLRLRCESTWRCFVRIAAVTAVILVIPIAVLQWEFSTHEFVDQLASLEFFTDWSTLFLLMVSLPLLGGFVLTDDHELNRALNSVRKEKVLLPDIQSMHDFERRWPKRFSWINRTATGLGFLVGAIVTIANYQTYTDPAVGFWIVDESGLRFEALPFLAGVFAFYFLVTVYVIRSMAITVALKEIVQFSVIDLIPFHPDHCGGLRAIGSIGLRNQYLLSLLGINLVLLFYISHEWLKIPMTLYILMGLACAAYLVLGPIVFLGPLMPFRDGMLKTKSAILSDIANRLKAELDNTRALLREMSPIEEGEQTIEKLRKLGEMVSDLPVWPFDIFTVRKFITAYLVPIISAVGFGPVVALISNLANS